jgi:bacterioferritin
MRQRAHWHHRIDAATPSQGADTHFVLRMLNEALATELVCVLRYSRHFFTSGIDAAEDNIRQEFLRYSQEEQLHADLIAERIMQLGGEPDFSPEGLAARSHSEYAAGATLAEMLRQDLLAERAIIDTYGTMIARLEGKDSTTRRMLAAILVQEVEHAAELTELLANLGAEAGSDS